MINALLNDPPPCCSITGKIKADSPDPQRCSISSAVDNYLGELKFLLGKKVTKFLKVPGILRFLLK